MNWTVYRCGWCLYRIEHLDPNVAAHALTQHVLHAHWREFHRFATRRSLWRLLRRWTRRVLYLFGAHGLLERVPR